MINRHYAEDNLRDRVLWSAVVLRDCSLRAQTSPATRRACRTVMREQAIKWRRTKVVGDGDSPQIH